MLRLGLAILLAVTVFATTGIEAMAQAPGPSQAQAPSKDAPGKGKAPAKSTMVLLCPKQNAGGEKVNVRCGAGEKCCYHPLFDNGSCVPEADGCMGIVNPLPRVPR